MDSETPLDEMFIALSDIHRRRLLLALQEHPREAYEMRISEGVHTGEETPERLRVKMFHIHLPKLEETGFIRWDRAAETVAKGPRFEEIRPLLELMDDQAAGLIANGPKMESSNQMGYKFRDWFECPDCEEHEEVSTLAFETQIVFECHECGVTSAFVIGEDLPLRNLDSDAIAERTDERTTD